MFAGKKSAQIREILISESAWEEMTCLFAPSLKKIVNEWIKYLLSINKNKNKMHIAMPIGYAICIYIINKTWLGVNTLLVLPFILSSIIFFQIRFSRKNNHTLFKRDFPEVLLMINMAASSGASINQVLTRY